MAKRRRAEKNWALIKRDAERQSLSVSTHDSMFLRARLIGNAANAVGQGGHIDLFVIFYDRFQCWSQKNVRPEYRRCDLS